MTTTILQCRSCSSENVAMYDAEASIHFPGLEGLHQPPVLAYPKLVVCLECGFAESRFSPAELQSLKPVKAKAACCAP